MVKGDDDYRLPPPPGAHPASKEKFTKPEQPKTRALTAAETEILSNRLKELQARPLRAPSPRTTAWKTTDASRAVLMA